MTTRRVAAEAGVNHGLVHYYFGSVENLLVRVLERFTDRLIARQRAMYADPAVPFAEKWRTAMHYLDADREYQKVWYELLALSWNRPELRARGDFPAGDTSFSATRTHRMATDPLPVLLSCYERYGPVFSVRVLHGLQVFLLGPEANHHVLVSNAGNFRWREGGFILGRVMGRR